MAIPLETPDWHKMNQEDLDCGLNSGLAIADQMVSPREADHGADQAVVRLDGRIVSANSDLPSRYGTGPVVACDPSLEVNLTLSRAPSKCSDRPLFRGADAPRGLAGRASRE